MHKLLQIFERNDIQTLFLMGIRGTSLVCKFGLTLFIARFIGFEVLGLYGLIIASTFIVPAFTGLGIMFIRTRNAVTQSTAEIVRTIFYYRRLISLIYVPLIMLAVIIGLYRGDVWIALLIGVIVMLEHVNNDFYNLMLNLSKPLVANILHFLRSAVWIVAFMAVAYIEPDFRTIEFLLLMWIIGAVLAVFGFFWVHRTWPWGDKRPLLPTVTWLKKDFQTSRTIYLNNIIHSSGDYINHFLVTVFLGLELTGIYVYFMQIVSALSNLLRTGVIQNMRPHLVKAHKSLDGTFDGLHKSCLKQTLFIAVVLSIIALPVMYFLTVYVVDKPLAIDLFGILWINLFVFILMMVMEVDQLILYSHHRDALTLKINALYVVGLLVLNTILIPFFSIWGTAIAFMVMMIIKVIVQRRFIRKVLHREVVTTEKNKYIFFRNDQKKDHFEFDPSDPRCLDEVGYKYFGRTLNLLEPKIKNQGLIIYVTAWTVHELPSYGPNVIACILQDEWSRSPIYRDKVKMVFRTCGVSPIVPQVYKYGGWKDIISNMLGQVRNISRGSKARVVLFIRSLFGSIIAPMYNIPLGYYCDEDIENVPIKDRENDLYFAGSINHVARKGMSIQRPKKLARDRMTHNLLSIIEGNKDIKVKNVVTNGFGDSIVNDNKGYLETMMDTKICPVPRGANLETFRFYEAIRYGCIPVGEVFPDTYFYKDAPILRLKNWSHLENVISPLLKDKDKLEKWHEKVIKWWDDVCSEKATANYMHEKINEGGVR